MTYPNEPYGQGFPGQQPNPPSYGSPEQYPSHGPQSGYPQQASYAQPGFGQLGHGQPGAHPYPQPGYPGGSPPLGYPSAGYPAPSPSGVTGIIAAVLAALGGVSNFVLGVFAAIGLAALSADSAFVVKDEGKWAGFIVATATMTVVGVLLLVGAVLLFLRKMIGRWLVVAGCVAIPIVSAIDLWLFADSGYASGPRDFLGLVFPFVTLVLVLLPTTSRWLRARQPSVQTAPPPYYPPYPG